MLYTDATGTVRNVVLGVAADMRGEGRGYAPASRGTLCLHSLGRDGAFELFNMSDAFGIEDRDRAIAYVLTIGSPPPIEIPDRLSGDGTGTELLYFDQAAIISPLKDAPPSFYAVLGSVKAVRPGRLEILGQRVTEVTMTVARAGDDHDHDVDIRLFVSDAVLAGGAVPQVGQQIQATIRLCARLWIANVNARS
jgi:hypothetical protein